MTNKTFTCDIYCSETFHNLLSQETTINRWNMLTIWKLQVYNKISNFISQRISKFVSFQGGVPIILAFLIFPLLNFKSPTFFMKFNVLGKLK